MLEDYRAGASIDLEHDEADRDRRVEVPLLVAVGVARRGRGEPGLSARRVAGYGPPTCAAATVDAGHFLVEERPAETLTHLAVLP